ncbi:uncharacterized protein CIMG_02574 [Coccidioides immitis RS]|uniref:NAD(P)-binding domain-containing protein n=3 Tax=Coccidioides immitis TaxID=5501 RepID=J3KLN0_COCIM|nr:uncharacterized protein CIMG_02574 [Coccidioides immitis RS]EAS37220.3 hypothetical protein CIMG_02574 [Coccidioides immitis RS]KMP10165.1 hypothetical protein CIRG_09398 [Coccidioides immitis RMSCC 2394]KMU80767.1 hypothetical protein CISG_08570 [Coccidioides immitis RMSCC 3703]TPX24787.1 hypothetical protein DIZ76_010230 [Coccidioides immitis]
MRVILLGATGNLGIRLVAALLAHGHQVVVYVRSPQKFANMAPEGVRSRVTVFHGDATDAEGLKTAIREHHCDAMVDTAGNQVWPWKEHQLQKIARAASQAAVDIGRERGVPMRALFICGLGELEYPLPSDEKSQQGKASTSPPNVEQPRRTIGSYLPNFAVEQHRETRAIINAIPLSDLRWTLVCIAIMLPLHEGIELLSEPDPHNLLTTADIPPAWPRRWVARIPWIGTSLEIIMNMAGYTTKLEHIADFIAEDLARGSEKWVGQLVGFREREKGQ